MSEVPAGILALSMTTFKFTIPAVFAPPACSVNCTPVTVLAVFTEKLFVPIIALSGADESVEVHNIATEATVKESVLVMLLALGVQAPPEPEAVPVPTIVGPAKEEKEVGGAQSTVTKLPMETSLKYP